MDRRKLGGVVATCSGALLVISLLLTWWGHPSAFEHPADLPKNAQISAQLIAADPGGSRVVNAFDLFEIRDIALLATGILGFGFGLCVLVSDRFPAVVKVSMGVVSVGALAVLIATLVSPPDYAELGPAGEKPFDFGVSLPLHPEIGVYIALASIIGLLGGVGLSIGRLRRTG